MIKFHDIRFGTSYMPECADEWLVLIHDIAVGYDGCRSEESLKALIDEMVEYAGNARKCMKQGNLYPNVGSKQTTNIDKIRAMSDEELSEFLWQFDIEEVAREEEHWLTRRKLCEWLQQSAEG